MPWIVVFQVLDNGTELVEQSLGESLFDSIADVLSHLDKITSAEGGHYRAYSDSSGSGLVADLVAWPGQPGRWEIACSRGVFAPPDRASGIAAMTAAASDMKRCAERVGKWLARQEGET